jgi:hypothetical protein
VSKKLKNKMKAMTMIDPIIIINRGNYALALVSCTIRDIEIGLPQFRAVGSIIENLSIVRTRSPRNVSEIFVPNCSQ